MDERNKSIRTKNSARYIEAFREYKKKFATFECLLSAKKSSITKFLLYSLYSALNAGLTSDRREKADEIELDALKNGQALAMEMDEQTGAFVVPEEFSEILEELQQDAFQLLREDRIDVVERQHLVLFLLLIYVYKAGELTAATVEEFFLAVGALPDPDYRKPN